MILLFNQHVFVFFWQQIKRMKVMSTWNDGKKTGDTGEQYNTPEGGVRLKWFKI